MCNLRSVFALVICGVAMLPALVLGSSPPSGEVVQGIAHSDELRYSVLYDFKAREAVPIVGFRISSLPRFFGTRLEPEVWTVAGISMGSNRGTLGAAVVFPYRAANNLVLYIGGAYRTRTALAPAVGLVLGLQLRL